MARVDRNRRGDDAVDARERERSANRALVERVAGAGSTTSTRMPSDARDRAARDARKIRQRALDAQRFERAVRVVDRARRAAGEPQPAARVAVAEIAGAVPRACARANVRRRVGGPVGVVRDDVRAADDDLADARPAASAQRSTPSSCANGPNTVPCAAGTIASAPVAHGAPASSPAPARIAAWSAAMTSAASSTAIGSASVLP